MYGLKCWNNIHIPKIRLPKQLWNKIEKKTKINDRGHIGTVFWVVKIGCETFHKINVIDCIPHKIDQFQYFQIFHLFIILLILCSNAHKIHILYEWQKWVVGIHTSIECKISIKLCGVDDDLKWLDLKWSMIR